MKREVWRFITKKRGVRKWNENNIGEKEWRIYFMELLEGEETEIRQKEMTVEVGRNVEEEIEIVRRTIKNLKVRKAAVDGIPMEACGLGVSRRTDGLDKGSLETRNTTE